MGIQAFVPSGGGGTPGFDYIASIRMETYNRSWSQAGAAGNYILTSNLNNSGYVYFVGATTTGSPLNKVVNVSHAFTRLDIVAPSGDYISLFKAAVKSTTVFANPFANFASFPSQITSSGNFVLPTSALPLVDALIVGAGGSGGGHHAGGGGGGGAVVKLAGYQAVGTTAVTIGTGASHSNSHGSKGGTTYFGNVYAVGGTGGTGSTPATDLGANGGGACGHGAVARSSTLTSSSSGITDGFGTQSGTASFVGGNLGGTHGGSHAGGGGGGAGGVGSAGSGASPGGGGAGHVSNITGSNYTYASGGGGGSHSPNNSVGSNPGGYGAGSHGAHNNPDNNAGSGSQGIVVVRYYIA